MLASLKQQEIVSEIKYVLKNAKMVDEGTFPNIYDKTGKIYYSLNSGDSWIFINEVNISTKGRHDPCVGIRAVPIGEAMLAITLADHILRYF